MDYECRIMMLEKQIVSLMNKVSTGQNIQYTLTRKVEKLEGIVRLNSKNSQKERASRNNLNPDSITHTMAAKEGGFRSVVDFNAQLCAQGVLVRKGVAKVPEEKWVRAGFFQMQNGQSFVTKAGMAFVGSLIRQGKLKR